MGAVSVQSVGRTPRSIVLAVLLNMPIQPSTNVGAVVANRGKMKASTKLKPMTSTIQRLSMTKPTRPSQPDFCRLPGVESRHAKHVRRSTWRRQEHERLPNGWW